MNCAIRNTRQARPNCGQRGSSGYTLVETMIAVSLFSLIVIGILAAHFAGLRFNQFAQPRLKNSQFLRQTVSRMIDEVRCANSVQVGSGTLITFTPAGATNLQSGNAVRIYPSTNLTQYVYYVLDSSSTLSRVQTPSTNAQIVATAVTNSTVFTMEDYSGRVLTNSQNNAVLGILLQMKRDSNWRGISDSAQVRTKVTRRNLL